MIQERSKKGEDAVRRTFVVATPQSFCNNRRAGFSAKTWKGSAIDLELDIGLRGFVKDVRKATWHTPRSNGSGTCLRGCLLSGGCSRMWPAPSTISCGRRSMALRLSSVMSELSVSVCHPPPPWQWCSKDWRDHAWTLAWRSMVLARRAWNKSLTSSLPSRRRRRPSSGVSRGSQKAGQPWQPTMVSTGSLEAWQPLHPTSSWESAFRHLGQVTKVVEQFFDIDEPFFDTECVKKKPCAERWCGQRHTEFSAAEEAHHTACWRMDGDSVALQQAAWLRFGWQHRVGTVLGFSEGRLTLGDH